MALSYRSRRVSLLRRIRRALRAAYLRRAIELAEQDAEIHDWHALLEPQLADVARRRAQELRVELACVEITPGATA